MPEFMTDAECEELLRLLHKYVTEYGSCSNMTVSEMAEDLAMSMDVTTDAADQYRREIEAILG